MEPAVDEGIFLDKSIEDLQQALGRGSVTSVALVQGFLQRMDTYDTGSPTALNTIQHRNHHAVAEAEQLDNERRTQGPRSLLHGIPILVKDNYETKGMPTTVGSRLFAAHAPERDAFAVARLKKAGAIVLGKTTMHEFAYGITTVGSLFGAARNPYDVSRNPGGSSGGTGAAIAANFAVVGMGSDTCGSIRIPAAHNNLVGLRGTQGLSSRHGIVPLSNTQDIGGPLARSVKDLAIVLEATVGYDPQDPQTAWGEGQAIGQYRTKLKKLPSARVGLLKSWTVREPADQIVAGVIDTALSALEKRANWTVHSLSSDALDKALDRPNNGHTVLIMDFANDINGYLSRNPEIGYENLDALIRADLAHPDVQPSLHASSNLAQGKAATYTQEMAQREVVRAALLELMQANRVDALAYPTIRRVAAKLGDEQSGTNCRIAANSGLPAITVPAGFTADGLPVGLELLAPPWHEQLLLNLAYTVEQAYPQRRLPGLVR